MDRSGHRAGDRGALLLVIAVIIGVVVAVQLVLAGLAVSANAWARSLEADETLLPGTVVAGADVGGMRVDAASDAVDAAVQERLDEPIVVAAGDQRWQVTPRDLGAHAASGDAVDAALAEASNAGPFTLARLRWFGGTLEVDAPLAVDAAQADAVVAELADDVDQDVRDATLAWSDGDVELVEHRDGRRLARGELRRDLVDAVRSGEDRVEGDVRVQEASVTTDDVAPHADPAARLVRQTMSHEVRVVAEGARWTVSPSDVDAAPELDELVGLLRDDADLAEATPGPRRTAPLSIPDAGLREYVDGLAAEIDVPARDAQLDWSTGWVQIAPHETGEALDRDAAARDLASALQTGEHTVELSVGPVRPDVTRDDYHHVLLLRQNERRLYHYVNGEIAADWPVAVGAGGSPTPTGQFAVGAKRHRPTWYNPDPTGWGADMPPVVEPGPQNPLGVRALNWHQSGADTLIRFHGTAAVSSIGTAASQGCVRLTNDDVRELYDRVPGGTAIVSIREAPEADAAPVDDDPVDSG